MTTIDVVQVKKDFKILSRKIEGNNLVYLDNAATSQKPKQVLEAIVEYYSQHNANVHRGAHVLGDEATQAYEDSRKKVSEFIGARLPKEIVFTKNSTDSLNQVAYGYASRVLKRGDVILTTGAEHNSNLLPWLAIAKQTGANVEFLTLDENGEISMNELRAK